MLAQGWEPREGEGSQAPQAPALPAGLQAPPWAGSPATSGFGGRTLAKSCLGGAMGSLDATSAATRTAGRSSGLATCQASVGVKAESATVEQQIQIATSICTVLAAQ